MREAKKKEINGITFQVSPFMVIEAMRLHAHIVHIAALPLAELVSGPSISKKVADLDLSGINLVGAIERLLSNLEEETLITTLKRLFQNVVATWTLNGKSHSIAFNSDFDVAMNLVFEGKTLSVYQLVVFVLEVNFPDFLDKVRPIGKKIKEIAISQVAEQKSKSEPETSEILAS
jgi:hypothetical protein